MSMDPSACRVIYIDERFNTERWISRDGLRPSADRSRRPSTSDFESLPPDLQINVDAFLSVFNQGTLPNCFPTRLLTDRTVYVCRSGRSFSIKLAEIHDTVKPDCTPILACFDVGSQKKHEILARSRPRLAHDSDSPLPSPVPLKRELTFSSETDESYGLQLLSRIASDLQVEEGVKLIIPVAVVQPQRKDSYDHAMQHQSSHTEAAHETLRLETQPPNLADTSDIIDPQLMLQCLDAGALDVVKAPLNKAGIMGLTVHAYRIYKSAKAEQSHYLSKARGRKQSWVGVDDEKPYAYLREAMVRKLLKGICDPQDFIEDYQHRDLFVEPHRKAIVAQEVGKWSFSGQDYSDDELVYAGYYILDHALTMPELEQWRMSEGMFWPSATCRVHTNVDRRTVALHARLSDSLQFFRALSQFQACGRCTTVDLLFPNSNRPITTISKGVPASQIRGRQIPYRETPRSFRSAYLAHLGYWS